MDEFDSPMKYERETNLILEYIGDYENINILDLGTGEGYKLFGFCNKLHSKIQSIVAVDNNKENRRNRAGNFFDFYDKSDGNIQIEFVPKCAIEYLNENHHHFDLILMSNFLHYFDLKEKKEIINLVLERLSERGIIYIKVGNEKHGDVDFPMKREDWTVIKNNDRIKVLYESELSGGFLEAILKCEN